MKNDTAEEFDRLDDRVYALEFAFLALAKSLHQAQTLDLLHLLGALQDLSAQLRAPAHPPGSPLDMQPVAAQLDALRDSLWQLQETREE